MKIVVFGASGETGELVVRQALKAGHLVTAYVRSPSKLEIKHSNLHIIQGDVMNAEKVEQAIAGQKAVISTLGPTRPPVPGLMEIAAKNIVTTMNKHGVKRLISTTGAGVRDPRDQPKLFDKVMKALLTIMARDVLRDSEANVNVIRSSDLDWTIIRLPRLMNGQHTGKYRIGYIGKDSGSQISRADGADFILRELLQNKYVHKAPIVSY